MESLPLIPKSKIAPNLDVTSVIREIFQAEFEAYVPSKKFSENLRKSLEYERLKEEVEEEKSFRSVCFLENLPREKRKLMEYAEKVFEAYEAHEEALNKITKVELNVMESQAVYLRRREMLRGNDFLCDLLKLKRRSLMKPYNPNYVKEYKLLQGDSCLPPKYEADLDFRMKDYKEWKKKLSKSSGKILPVNDKICIEKPKKCPRITEPTRNRRVRPKKAVSKEEKPCLEIFRAEPKLICFTEYEPGYTYKCCVTVRNVHTKPMKFSLRPLPQDSPFKVELPETHTSRILPGLGFKLLVTFEPENLEDENENLTILIEDGSSLVIPITSYMEPPLLKTHEEIDESTQNIRERIRSSYINCGECFPGDSKITKIRFYSFGGAGEFFLMTEENWSNWHIDCLTCDNFTDLPPFRLYPTYFKLEKNQVIDLFVEFKPTLSGLHSDNIMVVCNNGEVRNLDILGDGISWNRSFIEFEKNLEKDFAVYINDDHKALYYIDLGSTYSSGKIERTFCVSNNSIMPFEFRWEMRDVVIPFRGLEEEPEKLVRSEVRIQPSSGMFEPCTTRTFLVTVSFNRNRVASYRTVLSLYVIGLPYQSIEQASTIIRPSVLRRRFKSGSVYGEEDSNNLLLSPEFSYQGTYESVQEGMKTDGKYQQFPEKVCQKCPGICCIALRKSKTFSNISDGVDASISSPETVNPIKSFNDCFQKKRNITDLGSDLLWDFVDVLVDELELWVEVVPTIVTMEPCIINLFDNVRTKRPPVKFDVYVHNESDFPVTCTWVKSRRQKLASEEDSKEGGLSTLYHMNGLPQREESEPEECLDEEWDRNSVVSASSSASTNYQVTCYATQQLWGTKPNESANNHIDITIEPKGLFTVPSQSRRQCILSVSASAPGVINKVLTLAIGDDERVRLHVIGKVPDPEISVYPPVLDFGFQRSGSRPAKYFKIKNESNLPVVWKVEHYKFDHVMGVLMGPEEEKSSKGTLEENGYTIESYKLDTRTLGMYTYFLKFDLLNPSYSPGQSKYLIVLAYIHDAKLVIEAPRFGMAILAPSRTMYLGQMIKQTITLRNLRQVAAKFVWGRPFGCHCRKLEIDMCPKINTVGALKNVNINVFITPLEEGIVDHCYLPCFFSHRVNPVILSIVGVVRNIQVTFEVKKENLCYSPKAEIMKISWPIKNFDPCIGLSHISERDILDLACHCDEVEDYLNKTTAKIDDLEEVKPVDGNPDEVCQTAEEENEKGEENMTEDLTEGKNEMKGITLDINEEEPELGEETAGETGSRTSAVVEYSKRDSTDCLNYADSELQFFNALYKTVSVKDFVIRNESPLATKFNLRVRYFGKSEPCVKRNKIQEIKKKVFGREKNEFEENMMYGQPLLITTSPEEGILEGWEAIKVNVFVYGNTWGEYRDFIICNIYGMPPFIMKILVQLSGHPISFPMFTPVPDIPVVRFNTVKYKTKPVVRSIKVRNVSSIPVTVTWMVFLTLPISEEAKEEPFNLCLDFYTDKESEDPEKATKSSCNYLSKNASGSLNFLDRSDLDKSGSDCTGMSLLTSSKKESCKSELTGKTIADSTRPEIQLLENFGKVDLHFFQITPRELDLEPYSQEKINITFDPGHKQQGRVEEYEAVVTGCVRLRQEHAFYRGIYQRPCGKEYVTKLLQISASVEKPLFQFDILKSDLRFIVNANDVIEAKEYKITKKYLLRNRCQTPINALVKLFPGKMFSLKRLETLEKVYTKFDRPIKIEPGHSVQVHLVLFLERHQATDVYRRYKLRKRGKSLRAKSSEMIIEGEVVADGTEDGEEPDGSEKGYDTGTRSSYSDRKIKDSNVRKEGIRAIDSALVHGAKLNGQRSWNSVEDFVLLRKKKKVTEEEFYEEYYGEGLEISPRVEPIPEPEEEQPKLSYTVREELVFEQIELLKQKLTLEVEMFFPVFKLDPDEIYFGNVHIGETARGYTSVKNLTQYPIELGVTWSGERNGFSVYPSAPRVPASNYKPSIGAELIAEFTPEEPGYARKVFRIYGNKEMVFEFVLLTVSGFGTWDEKYKAPKTDIELKLPSIVLPY